MYDAAARVLTMADLSEDERAQTYVLLVTPNGDVETRAAVESAMESGRRLSPLLFVQSTPSSIVGRIANDWNIRGAITTVSSGRRLDDPYVLEMADELLQSDRGTAVLVIRAIPPTADSLGGAEAALITRGIL
ncbi:hypothetical protein C5C13_11770 [Clavibacter michiganensis]|nr:hypothetical protein C5C13_11770 [Clavibacter michiganensis]